MPPAPTSDKSTAASRGRNVASKPLNGAASSLTSKPKSATPVSTSEKTSRAPSESSSLSAKSTSSGKNSKIASGTASTGHTPSESGFKVTKLSSSTVTLQSTWSPKPILESAKTSAPIPEQPSSSTTDPLHLAAQVYPWIYMSSALDACFDNAETTANNDLETRAKELSAEESEISDKRVRLEAERAIEFYDELSSDAFVKDAPIIMKLFHSNGESCTRIETEALKLAMREAPDLTVDEPLKVYQDMLQELDKLHAEATDLQESILKLSRAEPSAAPNVDAHSAVDASSARSQVSGVFAACLPVLRARLANLSMAQELIDSALENVSLSLRMESMGLND